MKKLKNERGESILMALLLLLLASVISALILTAATNAAHHLRNDRKVQQNYLTVSSAAELIRDSILQESYTRVWEKVTTYTKDDAGTYVPKEEKTTLAPGKFTGIMRAWLAAGIENNENEGAAMKVTAPQYNLTTAINKASSAEQTRTVAQEAPA